ncbi:sugar transferase [uncultured Jannaschia sp.]|uniref:sugar transferase n=1 Tax=uncultured Jannaschia sp. TaxID=293347 RepID=UPI00261FB220|nr:sugar transferase [uncultured Jannaschia sp.]
MTDGERLQKRAFDLVGAGLGLAMLWPVIAVCWVVARRDTGASGFFLQTRIGQFGQPFEVIKIRTMRLSDGPLITTADDPRITPTGALLRRWKLDELPQLWNILRGEMSFVGPRPDVPGYLDRLEGEGRRVMSLRPGITGPATLKYRDEEALLAAQADPVAFNDRTIWPDKVRINLAYLDDWSLAEDIRYIVRTLRP